VEERTGGSRLTRRIPDAPGRRGQSASVSQSECDRRRLGTEPFAMADAYNGKTTPLGDQ
jgi:hypothetical protein